MPDSVLVALVTVAAGAIGYVARPLGDWITDRRLTARERETKRDQFQTETILALQDEMATAVVEATEASNLSGRAHAAQAQAAQLKAGSLAARVRDEEVRRLVALFRDAVTALLDGGKVDGTYEEKQARIRLSFDAANERISVVLRSM
jgi:NH3-dependent NAD+ synthetase